jgi:hypothetical protein
MSIKAYFTNRVYKNALTKDYVKAIHHALLVFNRAKQFEHGPDGRIIFNSKKTVYEVKVFSYGGNIVTEKYYVHSN